MRIDIDDVRELINQRLQLATEDYEETGSGTGMA